MTGILYPSGLDPHVRHSGLDPESSIILCRLWRRVVSLDSRLRGNDGTGGAGYSTMTAAPSPLGSLAL